MKLRSTVDPFRVSYPLPLALIAGFVLLATSLVGCTSTSPRRDVAETKSASPYGTDFGRRLDDLGLRSYRANLHAHHFMEVKGSKKNPLQLGDVLREGDCHKGGTFTMDDGRPCRATVGAENATILPRKLEDGSFDLADYFRQACEYGTSEGELDVLFVTPHTKNNGVGEQQIVASTSDAEMKKRAAMLGELNVSSGSAPSRYCGLGQETSSISTGNHINIFGQFRAGKPPTDPVFFAPGDFSTLYARIKQRNSAGENLILQMNHPGVKRDLWWDDLAKLAAHKTMKKEGLNDYGLDDFAPIGCLLGKLTGEACAGVSGTRITTADLKTTFAEIRRASGDPFRLIEVVPPGPSLEGGEEPEDSASEPAERFGATNNPRTTFRSVHYRTSVDTYEEGVYDWIFYLSMGFKLAPTANQDNHHMNFGSATASRTGIVANDLREESILGALRSRRTFASEDRNAQALLTFGRGRKTKTMGDSVSTSRRRDRLQIGYFDPDRADATAQFRVYYYRASDTLDFSYKADRSKVFRTIGFDPKGRAVLPLSNAIDRSKGDLLAIRNGETIDVDLPLERGSQWVFVELIQDGDFDKIWTAPIWIDRR